jgi:Co/Zn/Cd efflux system component
MPPEEKKIMQSGTLLGIAALAALHFIAKLISDYLINSFVLISDA